MENYKEILEKLYLETIEDRVSDCPPDNRLQFIGSDIFDFTTYDKSADELFAKNMLEVLECILNKTTFVYQELGEEKYLNYLTMVNMPFLQGKLDWGGSIRGAWLDQYGHHSDQEKIYQITHDFSIPKKEINEFIKQLIEWANGK